MRPDTTRRIPVDPLFMYPRHARHEREPSDISWQGSAVTSLSNESSFSAPLGPFRRGGHPLQRASGPQGHQCDRPTRRTPLDPLFSHPRQLEHHSRSPSDFSQATTSSSSEWSPIPRVPPVGRREHQHMYDHVPLAGLYYANHPTNPSHRRADRFAEMGFRSSDPLRPSRPPLHHSPLSQGTYPRTSGTPGLDEESSSGSLVTHQDQLAFSSNVQEREDQSPVAEVTFARNEQICEPGGILRVFGRLFGQVHPPEDNFDDVTREDTPLEREFLCPIQHTIMIDPVVDRDGYSYERRAIVQWLEKNRRSPFTRKPLSESHLRPNRALKAVIQRYLADKEVIRSVETGL